MRRSPGTLLLMLLGTLAGAGTLVLPATATERTVTDCGDTVPGGAQGQLRRLINDAVDGDLILIPACTVTLQGAPGDDGNLTGDLDVVRDLTLQGAGPGRTTIDGGAVDRVLHVVGGFAALSGLTLRNGKPPVGQGGGGIFVESQGALQLTDVEVRDSHAPGDIGGLGGGLLLRGPATLTHVTVADNVADGGGGGVYVWSPGVSLVNVTVSGNRTSGDGGGLLVQNGGAATLNNATLTTNQASLGQFAGFGGGILVASGGELELRNTILAGNSVASNGGAPDCGVFAPSAILSRGTNLIQQTAGCTRTGTPGNDLVGVAPGLGPLQDNGGPTRTHALLPGSPALDHGDGACAAVDQRRVPRPQGRRCDIGAYERLRLAPGRLEGGRLQ